MRKEECERRTGILIFSKLMTRVRIIATRTGTVGHVETQSVATGNMREAELLNDSHGHGALAGCRRAEYYSPEDRGGAKRGDRHHEELELQR